MSISLQRLTPPRLVAALLSAAPLLGAYSPEGAVAALSPYGHAAPLEHACLASGAQVSGEGSTQFGVVGETGRRSSDAAWGGYVLGCEDFSRDSLLRLQQ